MARSRLIRSWPKGGSDEVRLVITQDDFGPERLHLRYFSRGFPTKRGVTLDATLEDVEELLRGATAAREFLAQRARAV